MSSFKSVSIVTLILTCALLSLPAYSGVKAATLGPVPANPEDLAAQLKRFAGQTRFLNPANRYRGPVPMPGSPRGGAQKSAPAAGQRAQQESDIFKVGKPGSKLLYLLNDYRGLQAVSFADGIDKAKLLGRAEATGNWSDTMYYDASHDRLVVLERYWYDNSESYVYSSVQSRALVYDVKDPTRPHLASQLQLEGEIADSRIVGDVLYIATSTRPDWRGSESKGKGYVYSIRLAVDGPELIERAELALPSSARENMNIVETNENGTYKYYLLAVLSESGWGWWDRQSLVEVVDISDPKGSIKPVMVVSAKGMIAKRSQTSIKNNTLIVTSNYWPQSSGTQKPMRVSVETFTLPLAGSEVLTEDEALFRKLGIDRALRGKTESERDVLYEKLVSDPELGIKGRLVRTADGKLRKIIPDSVVTVGDTNGLGASLRDVRFDGDLLEVFWVPSNNIDPFDVFDISHPEAGVKYLKRLQFDGWIDRAEPIVYQGKRYVLGLGWVVPAVNNENNRRYPQAMLFELRQKGAQLKLESVAQLTLANGNVWANFNGADKYVEISMTAEGKGQILFAVDSWDQGKYLSGGKLIGFDLNKAVNGDDGVFEEGTLLVGSPDWLRRVFTNPEIERVNTFSNTALATFDVKNVGAPSSMAKAIQVLELARDVQGYVTLGAGENQRGIQIVSSGNWWDENTAARTTLRLVRTANPDAELPEVLATQSFAGQFLSSLVDSRDQSLWVATRQSKRAGEGNNTSYIIKYNVYRVTLDFAQVKNVNWTARQASGASRWHWYGGNPFQLVQLEGGTIVAKADTDLYALSESREQLSAQLLEARECSIDKQASIELQVVDHSLYLASKVLVEDPVRENVSYTRNFVSPVQIGSGVAVCSKGVNIPGKLLAALSDGRWITEDDRLLDIVKPKDAKYYDVLTSSALDLVQASNDSATLTDDYAMRSNQAGAIKQVGPTRFAFMDSRESSYGRQIYDRLVVLGLDKAMRFTKETFALGSASGFNGQLVEVFQENEGSMLGVLSNGRKLKVIRWGAGEARPTEQRLVAVRPNSSKAEPNDSVTLNGWYYSTQGGSGIHYSPQARSLEVARGLFGVQQFLIE